MLKCHGLPSIIAVPYNSFEKSPLAGKTVPQQMQGLQQVYREQHRQRKGTYHF